MLKNVAKCGIICVNVLLFSFQGVIILSDTEKIEAYNGTEPYIFFSYSHKDKEIANRLLKQLVDNGYRVWYDKGIEISDEWRKIIARNIKKCTH